MQNNNITVLLIGATGLVGSHTLLQLLEQEAIAKVKVISRRKTGITHPKLVELVTEFDLLEQHQDFLMCDIVVSCLGSTIKKAGSKENFEKFDFQYPFHTARICKENGTQKMVLLSAMGAKRHSMVFYNQVKGKLEETCIKLNFDSLVIIRPSLIVGKRNEQRTGESFAIKVMGFLDRFLPVKYQSVSAIQLASTIVKYCISPCEEHVQIIDKNNFALKG